MKINRALFIASTIAVASAFAPTSSSGGGGSISSTCESANDLKMSNDDGNGGVGFGFNPLKDIFDMFQNLDDGESFKSKSNNIAGFVQVSHRHNAISICPSPAIVIDDFYNKRMGKGEIFYGKRKYKPSGTVEGDYNGLGLTDKQRIDDAREYKAQWEEERRLRREMAELRQQGLKKD
mmetsp:Transcript_34472/g.69634  ORF Transcript_34472/g.69634 Transcript_34472/m.69634 type:complete len:178 (-) Transcript_34472:1123-1656(-)